jgi:hypothetical protein
LAHLVLPNRVVVLDDRNSNVRGFVLGFVELEKHRRRANARAVAEDALKSA